MSIRYKLRKEGKLEGEHFFSQFGKEWPEAVEADDIAEWWGQSRGQTTLEDNDKVLTSNQMAQKLASNYEEVSYISITKYQQRQATGEQRRRNQLNTTNQTTERSLLLHELY